MVNCEKVAVNCIKESVSGYVAEEAGRDVSKSEVPVHVVTDCLGGRMVRSRGGFGEPMILWGGVGGTRELGGMCRCGYQGD